MPERLSNEVVIKTNGAAIVSSETQCVTTSPVPAGTKLPALADYVKRVRNIKNGVCYDQPFMQPTAVKNEEKAPEKSEKDKEKEPPKGPKLRPNAIADR